MQTNRSVAFNLPQDKYLIEYINRIPTGAFSELVRTLLKGTDEYRLYIRTIREDEEIEDALRR